MRLFRRHKKITGLYQHYVSQNTDQLIASRQTFLNQHDLGYHPDLDEEAVLQQVLSMERGIPNIPGCLAELEERSVAKGIDGLLIYGCLLLAQGIENNLVNIGCYIITIGYFLFGDALPGGKSVGHRLIGVAVVTEKTRQPCGVFRAMLRNLMAFTLVLDVIFVYGVKRKLLGDMLAGTIVIKTNYCQPWLRFLVFSCFAFSAFFWLVFAYTSVEHLALNFLEFLTGTIGSKSA